MRSFFHEVKEFFAGLFEKQKPSYIGFLWTPSVKDKPRKAKCQLGFRKGG